MSLKDEFSEDRKNKLQELENLTQEVYDKVVIPAFRRAHEADPLEKELFIRVKTSETGRIETTQTYPNAKDPSDITPLPFLNCDLKGLSQYAWEETEMFQVKAKEIDANVNVDVKSHIITFRITLDD